MMWAILWLKPYSTINAMKISIKIDNDELNSKLTDLPQDVLKEVDQALLKAAIYVEAQTKVKIQRGPRSGHIYRRGRTRFHQASAPGEPPKTDTGNLVSHIIHAHPSFLRAEVISGAAYASFLEYGTKHMAARPYLAPTLDESSAKIDEFIDEALGKALK